MALPGPPSGHDPEQIEGHDRVDRGQDHDQQQHRPQPGQRDPEEALGPRRRRRCAPRGAGCPGIDCRPARIRSEASGAWFQTWTSATMLNASRAVGEPGDRLVDQAEVEQQRIERPVLPSKIQLQSMPTATGAMAQGISTTLRRKLRPGKCWLSTSAIAMPRISPPIDRDHGEIGGARRAPRGNRDGAGCRGSSADPRRPTAGSAC